MKEFPVTLSIAGSDSGGGAGIQADLKTFSALKTFGTTAVTCLTAQNPNGVSAIQEIPSLFIKQQLLAILDFFPVGACKTGMLFSTDIIITVVEILKKHPQIKLIVDPVMIATSGAKLLQDDAIDAMKRQLIPLAHLITPNLDEASHLLGKPISFSDDLIPSAKELFDLYQVPVLLKGGHLPNATVAIDILFDGTSTYEFIKPFLKDRNTHGTGCTYSSAITAFIARGYPIPEAVGQAKEYIHHCLVDSIITGPVSHLHHSWEMKS